MVYISFKTYYIVIIQQKEILMESSNEYSFNIHRFAGNAIAVYFIIIFVLFVILIISQISKHNERVSECNNLNQEQGVTNGDK